MKKNPSARNLGTWQSPNALLRSEGFLGGGQVLAEGRKTGGGSGRLTHGPLATVAWPRVLRLVSDSVPGCTTRSVEAADTLPALGRTVSAAAG